MRHHFFEGLRPPAIDTDENLRFVLAAVFRRGTGDLDRPLSTEAAWRWAEVLRLIPMLSQRISPSEALCLLGPGLARALDIAREECAHRSRGAALARERVCEMVEESGIEAVLLERDYPSAAAAAGQHMTPAAVQMLVLPADIRRIADRLGSRGCQVNVESRMRLSRPAPVTRLCSCHVSVYTELAFTRLVLGGPHIDLAGLRRCAMLELMERCGKGRLYRPTLPVVAAFSVACALVRDRFDAAARSFGALVDAQRIGLDQDEGLALDTFGLLQTDLDYSEYEGWRSLPRACSMDNGVRLAPMAQTVLCHLLASAIDGGYRKRLWLQRKSQVWQHRHLDDVAERIGRFLKPFTRIGSSTI